MNKYPQSKLSPEQIKEIIDHPEIKASAFAKKYGVTKQGIYYQRAKAKNNLAPNKSEQERTEEKPGKQIIEQPEEQFDTILEKALSFEAHLFELATVHNKNITITIEIG